VSPAWARNRILVGTALLFAARLAISLFRTGPVLVADEIGYLTNARVLTGGLPGQFDLAPFYKGGYSVLIAPVVGIVSDPQLAYHLVLVLNAALAAAVFPLLYLLLRRHVGVPTRAAVWAAFAGALYPAVTTLSQVAMTENALFPLVCLWLVAWGGLLASRDGDSVGWAVGLGASTGALWAVHNRLSVAVVLTVGLLLWLAFRGRIGWRTVGLATAVVGMMVVGSHLLDSFLVDRNYGSGVSDEAGSRFRDVLEGDALLTVAANAVGQAWYAIAATFGLLLVVAVDSAERLRPRARDVERPAPVTLILLGLTALLLLISAAAFPERTRPDMLVYGRYAEIAAPPLVAIGVALLAAGRVPRRLGSALIGFGGLTALVVAIRVASSDPGFANRWNVSSLPFLTFELGAGVLIGAAIIACAGAGLLAWAGLRRPSAVPAAATGLLLAVAAYGLWNPVRSAETTAYPAGWESPEPVAERAGIDTVAYDVDHYDVLGLYPIQWFLPDTRVLTFRGDRAPPPSRYVIGVESWNREHPAHRGREMWRDAGTDQVMIRIDRDR
jgi:hypothetical protein